MKRIIQVGSIIAIVVLINFIGSFKFGRYDLTEEKIHSLSPKTIEILQNDSLITDELKFEIYLAGEMSPELRKLQNAIKEKLNEFKAYAGNKIYYEIIDPNNQATAKANEELKKQLIKDFKLYPTAIYESAEGEEKVKEIFGGIILRTVENNTAPIQILQPTNRPVQIPVSAINKAINNIEYSLLEGIYKVANPHRSRIGFLQGHGELTEIERIDVTSELSKFHSVKNVTIDGKIDALNRVDALIIAKPTEPISFKDQYIIDQFIMKGGKVAWLIDPVEVNVDTLVATGSSFGLERPLNDIDAQLFSYGVRLNKNLIVDVNSSYLYFAQGTRREKWFYYPQIDTWRKKNLIADNVNPIRLKYASSIDLLKNEEIKKTPLLVTSDKTLLYNVPVRVNYQMIRLDTNAVKYGAKPYQNVAVLLEGKFTSYFKNRLTDQFVNNKTLKHLDEGTETSMLVVGDGDLIKNGVDSIKNARGQLVAMPLNLNRDRYDPRINYGNKEFFVNAVEYMLGMKDLIPLRSKTITLRPLNKNKIAGERNFWQVTNIVLPIVLILIFGVLYNLIRRRSYK